MRFFFLLSSTSLEPLRKEFEKFQTNKEKKNNRLRDLNDAIFYLRVRPFLKPLISVFRFMDRTTDTAFGTIAVLNRKLQPVFR